MQGSINFDGTLSGSIAGGGGGGTEVTITPVVTSGTKIADYSIDQTPGSLYAPTPEALPGTIVTKALRKYNDTSQTKIMTVTTLDTSNNQEVSQDIYAPSPVQCWYTPGLEQDYQIGQFTYGGVTQNVYIPYFQRPLTAGANITIDSDNVISASGGSSWDYSTTEVNTGQKWIDGKDIYCRVVTENVVTGDNSIVISGANEILPMTIFTGLNINGTTQITMGYIYNLSDDYIRGYFAGNTVHIELGATAAQYYTKARIIAYYTKS